jgi:DNA recombination protein RmuC
MVTALLAALVAAALVGAVAVVLVARITAAQAERQLAAEALLARADGRDDALQETLHHTLAQLGRRLDTVGDTVARLREDRAGQHGQLLERVTEAHRVTEALRTTTEGLQRALANPQARGQWGERMADDVLRAAGMIEGVNYVKQRTLPDGTRPDLTFLLPDDRCQHMDVKFPLAAYLRWCEATTEPERATAIADFLRDVRQRVRELARPGYADETTTGFVLLFIPNESVYGFIHGHDPALADEALARKVVLCSPFTLFAVLGVIRQAADAVAIERGADEVLDLLAGFHKQWEQFTERLDTVGKQLQTVQNTYEQLNGPRRRQLEKQLDRVDDVRRRRGLDAGDGDGDGDGDVLREVSSW